MTITSLFHRPSVRNSAHTLREQRERYLADVPIPPGRGWDPLQTRMADVLSDEPATIADVIEKQVTIQGILDELPPSPTKNRVAAFNQLYLTITRRVDGALQSGVHWPEFLEMLDVEFAKRYFRALHQWNVNDEGTPDVWEVLFKRAHDVEMSSLAAAVLGVNAHINHDLSLALVATWERLGPPTPKPYPDYNLVNKIFYEEIPGLRRGFSDEWQMHLDRLAGPLDDWSQRILVKVTRAEAWDQALHLWEIRNDPADFEQHRRTMDRAASLLAEWLIFGDRIVTDGGDVVEGGLRFFRKVLGGEE